MPTDAMSLEDIKIQREAMQKKIGDTEKKLEDSLKEREGFEALILSMERVAEWKEKQKQQLAEKVKEDKARLEEEICQLKLAVQGLSLAQEDCGSISDAQEDCDSISDASKATSKVTLVSTIHSRKRMAERDMPRCEVQHVVKHGGEGVLQENGNRKVSLEGKNVILDRDEPRVVTVFKDEPQEQEFQVVKHSKQRTHKGPQMAGLSHGSIPLKEDIEWFQQENTSLDAKARRRLDCLRGLEARMSQEDLHKLIAPMASGSDSNATVADRVWNLLKSIAEQWEADEVDEYIRAHGLRDDPANMLRGLPEDKKAETMQTTFFFDVRCKSSYLFKKLSV